MILVPGGTLKGKTTRILRTASREKVLSSSGGAAVAGPPSCWVLSISTAGTSTSADTGGGCCLELGLVMNHGT